MADGLILAGGKSSRMGGRHKGALACGQETFLEHTIREMQKEVTHLWISYGREILDDVQACGVVLDEYPGCGPIGGIHAGLKVCEAEMMYAAACDMPFLKRELFLELRKELGDFDGAVPVVDGKIHPLAAIYRKRILPVLEQQIKKGDYRLRDVLSKLKIVYIDMSEREEFREMLQNINTTEEYRQMFENNDSKRNNPPDNLTLEEAEKVLLSRVEKIEKTEEINLWNCVGRVLSKDVTAIRNQPPFSRSPLDGYAVKSEDIAKASKENPIVLSVLGEVDAGEVFDKKVVSGTAVRIMTGAPIPEGADCVIRQEDTDYGEEQAEIRASLKPFQNYCFEGEDYKKGAVVLEKGTVLGAAEAGVLASLGKSSVSVYQKPKVVLLTTGDEIVLPGEELLPGKIYDSNLYTLGTRLLAWGTDISYRGRAGDDAQNIADVIRREAQTADIIVTTGGVSVGKKDMMHEVLEILGCERLFWKIAIKPGMPTLCAQYNGKLLICLSGNPYGAAVNLELLVRPLLAKIMRRKDLEIKRIKAISKSEFLKKSKVTRYVRARYEDGKVSVPEGSNASGVLSSMCGCSCLIEIEAGTACIRKGDSVWIVLL